MYGIFTYIWAIFGVNVGKYSIHGAFGYVYIYIHNNFILWNIIRNIMDLYEFNWIYTFFFFVV